ncbi:MAG: hypothetical protein LBP20_03785 [Treponema sp.]|jgi:hypothetical protein|nr:hypothetical protein [Treponema sp.]
MRKVLVLLFIAAGAGLFAQDIKFDGYFNSGVGLISSDRKEMRGGEEETVYPKFKAFGTDSEQWGYRFRLNGSFTNKDGNAGFKFRLQSQARTDKNGWIGLPYAYGWVSFFDKRFTLNGGIVDNGTWNSGGAILDEDMGEGLGILAAASPIEGLNLGIGTYLINTQSGSNNNALYENDSAGINFSGVDVTPWNAKYTFNVGYTMEDMIKLSAVYRLKNKAGGAPNTDYTSDYQYGGREESSRAILAAKLLMVENLTAVVEAEIDKMEHFKSLGNFNVYETLGYKAGNLGVGLNMAQYTTQNDTADDLGLRFNPWVSYAIKSVVPRLDLVYFNAGIPENVSSTSDDWKYYRRGYKANYNNDYHTFTIRPSVKFNLDSKTFVEIGDAFSYIMAGDGDFTQAGDTDNDSRLINVFYVDFKWSF